MQRLFIMYPAKAIPNLLGFKVQAIKKFLLAGIR